MKQLSIKDVPDEVYAEWRILAFRDGVSFRDWVIGRLGEVRVTKAKPTEDTEMLEAAQKRLEERKRLEPEAVPMMKRASGHDTENCRLYGCLQCKDAGVKNRVRGL